MDQEKFSALRDELISHALQISDLKGEDYRVGNKDVLHNFKTVGQRLGIDPMKVLGVYALKHEDAIANYIKSGGQSESEPIKMRIIDSINYKLLLWGMINDDSN